MTEMTSECRQRGSWCVADIACALRGQQLATPGMTLFKPALALSNVVFRAIGAIHWSLLFSQVSDPLLVKFSGVLGVAVARFWRPMDQRFCLIPDPWAAVRAMQAHRSQWVW